jgi:hypothetical protein
VGCPGRVGLGLADGAAVAVTRVGTGVGVAVTCPARLAVGLAEGAAVTGGRVGVGVGVVVAVAVAAALCVSWAVGALAECDAPDEAAAFPDVAAAPEQPVSARPAATPSPVTHSTGPSVTRGVFECDRICLLLAVIATMTSAPGNTA